MASYECFEDLPVWQEAARLYNRVLDLMAAHAALFSPGYRGQIDRAALSVSNNIAEGFERMTTAELLTFIEISRGSAGETKSMIAIVIARPEMAPARPLMQEIRDCADSCVRQMTGWIASIEGGSVQGKRHLTGPQKLERKSRESARSFRSEWLNSLKPEHPLYASPEARIARGEAPYA